MRRTMDDARASARAALAIASERVAQLGGDHLLALAHLDGGARQEFLERPRVEAQRAGAEPDHGYAALSDPLVQRRHADAEPLRGLLDGVEPVSHGLRPPL